jgi:hypothetical protein
VKLVYSSLFLSFVFSSSYEVFGVEVVHFHVWVSAGEMAVYFHVNAAGHSLGYAVLH